MKYYKYLLLIGVLVLVRCRSNVASVYDFPKPVDTHSQSIVMQDKRLYKADDVSADNRFDGARLNNFFQVDDQTFQVDIFPENTPINPSPWYSFKIWSDNPRQLDLILNYDSVPHRYQPWLSNNGIDWSMMDSTKIEMLSENKVKIHLQLARDTLWVSAQELVNSERVRTWCLDVSRHAAVHFDVVGKSLLGKDIYRLRIGEGIEQKKPTIIILSRQHPPEVTGYFAMQAFIDEILKDNPVSNAFREKYEVLVYPLMNPDGVDLGHWRHNAGGIDLNRDWAYYRQPETRTVANDIVKKLHKERSKVILGLDFHSTWYDIFYTNIPQTKSLTDFKDFWIYSVKESIQDSILERASEPLTPVSKSWFYEQFNAVGITYEIGDGTSRPYIKEKGETTAREMMKLLLYKD
ncbi:MAG: hypothetical protein KDC53_24650 [Saprospiraceae bacterium]|nr:hypothetical protein [Saprospiraceae bacterium]